ncbi:hypothetical protein XELAEV_18029066mg [Xenopus laevis]|uniref:Afadin n=1 Tax=Xenopus laevis TaxID=8355 RepID=A0A974CSC5_XENLA|nr:hypothetical protein XELAEV_18029066mg [Xenopus laevis]
MSASREEERRKLADIINHWNANRLDLFEISQPTEDLEFHGVMRFYFQDKAAGNFATKCIRVSSTATTQDVIETLAEKFRPDMRMLSSPRYSLYEVHVSGEERKLDFEEKPLVVQLNWNKDDREGRFVLKNENIFPLKAQSNGPEKQEKEGVIQNFKRTLSKKEKKEKKRREREQSTDKEEQSQLRDDGDNLQLAMEVYKDMPETSFTRTISNPEVVMKRRRQQKLEKRMQEFRSSDGRPDSGGTLRIYADSLKPNIPYKTILLSTNDTADFAVIEALEKYGMEKENPKEYCIAKVILSPGAQHSDKGIIEFILDDEECPLHIFRDWPNEKGELVFQLKRRPTDSILKQNRKHDGKSGKSKDRTDHYSLSLSPDKLPYLVELSADGSDSRDKPKLYRLQPSVTEVGTEKFQDNSIQLFGPGIQHHHCDLNNMDGVVTVTPRRIDADTYVDGHRISETTMLHSGVKVQFGSSHVFKFVDPNLDHLLGKSLSDTGQIGKNQRTKQGLQETTFGLEGDVLGDVTTPANKMASKLDGERIPGMTEKGMVKPMIRMDKQQDQRVQNGRSQDSQGPENVLPASIEFRENSEDAFLSAVINYTNSSTVHFKLSPTYVLYMTCRYVLSNKYRPDTSSAERTHKVIAVVNKMVGMMESVIQKQKNIAGALAFWMANASELLNFIKQDRDLNRITLDAQDVLAHLVQMAFKYLVHCLQSELTSSMPAFIDDPEENDSQRPKIEDVLHTLTGAMSLLRRCRVNAALTIQLFSQLFHFINMWLFNRLATTLLTMDKYSHQDIPNINNTCFKLNSLQLQALLQNYHCAPDEPYIPTELIDSVVSVAENTADELARSDGREVQLEEDPDLQLPFLLPEDGYSCDVVRNIPNGLQEFLEPLCQRGFCRLVPHSRSPGIWTIYFEGADYENHLLTDNTDLPLRKEPEIITVTLKKQNGMGLSIVAAKGAGQEKLGIYIKSVVKGGAAEVDGRLAAGDQLISVDGQSLVGLSQERAAELMTRTGAVVTLEVAKQGAIYHGLATLLNQPSPLMQRGDRRGSGKPRPKSEGFELYNNTSQNGSPDSPPAQWPEYTEPKKLPGDDKLMKNRTDHRSSPNVANQPQSPGGKTTYSSSSTVKITSVSTGNLCTEEETAPARPEAYPIPTQTYAREYFTFPTPKSQDRIGPAQNHWQGYDDKFQVQMGNNHAINNSAQQIAYSNEELRDNLAFQPERGQVEPQMRKDVEHLERNLDAKETWFNQGSSMESSTSCQDLNNSKTHSTGSLSKTGPGRWKTPISSQSSTVILPQPVRTDLPPPPPPPVHYGTEFEGLSIELPLPPPPSESQLGLSANSQAAALERKKREEHQRWYEKEKARLEEERERKRREQERKLGQVRPQPPTIPPQPVLPQSPPLIPPPNVVQVRTEKPATLPRQQETVIRELQPQQQPRTIERRDLQYITVSKEELSSSDSLSPDPWKRDAKEKLEKQQQMHIVDMLSKEINELQSKPDRTSEENDRLRKLMLEWQFQKRLQESQQKDDDDDDDEDDDDVDTLLIMQRLEAERKARLQDEERRRQQHLEEVRKREAEDRLRQEEEHRHQEEERARREAEEKRRQEEEYYNRLELERRRIHDEAERRLLEPEEPGLYRPPLPREYELSNPTLSPNPPPPPPQRNTSYLKTQALSPDTVYTAKFVTYTDDEEDTNLSGPNSFSGSSGAAVSSNDVYKGPRDMRIKSQDEEAYGTGGAPESLTFKERQRLFSQGQDVSNKVKASRKLMELENELNTK